VDITFAFAETFQLIVGYFALMMSLNHAIGVLLNKRKRTCCSMKPCNLCLYLMLYIKNSTIITSQSRIDKTLNDVTQGSGLKSTPQTP
jgi:hypothetical protein